MFSAVFLRLARRLRVDDAQLLEEAYRDVNAHVADLAICHDCDHVYRVYRRTCPQCASASALPLASLVRPVGARVVRMRGGAA